MAEGGYWPDEKDHERPKRHRGLCNHLPQVAWEHESIETCTVMNSLGYGPHIRKARRDAYRVSDRISSARRSSYRSSTTITTGSKAEGLTSPYESDIDVMFIQKDVMCLAIDVSYDTLPMEITVFTLNTGVCYHGHCILVLERPGANICNQVYNSLCAFENGRALLSSDLYAHAFNEVPNSPTTERHERAGPSTPVTFGGFLHIDMVHSLRCNCPSILRKWADRCRHWPHRDVVHKVVSMGAFVAPVGFKGSEYKHLEWRICFNAGENYLVGCLNNTQVYIYVLLKMIIKEVLKPLKKELSSYTAKNIVLWIAENNPQEKFSERTLFYWLREGLVELRSAILTEHLSYFMIPERNLMAACEMEEFQKRSWVQIITDMTEEGPKVLLRLTKIRKAIIFHPEPLMWFSSKRVELDLLDLIYTISTGYSDDNGVDNWSETIRQAIERRTNEIDEEFRQRTGLEGGRDFDPVTYMQLNDSINCISM